MRPKVERESEQRMEAHFFIKKLKKVKKSGGGGALDKPYKE